MPTEYELYLQDKLRYDTRATCRDLEPNFSEVLSSLQSGGATMDPYGQIIYTDVKYTLAGFYHAPITWSDEAKIVMDDGQDTSPFTGIVLVKNPGRVNQGIYADAGTGAVNGLVMVGNTLWCAAMEGRRSEEFQLIRRVADLYGGGRDYQTEFAFFFHQLLAPKQPTILPWKLPVPTW